VSFATKIRFVGHEVRRVAQTPRTFENWSDVLGEMLLARFGKGPIEHSFVTRTGLTIETPNQAGARVPIYEIFAEDSYGLKWFLGELARRPIRVIDVGAHIGTFACQLAMMNPQATIECFEPSRLTADYLRRNIASNKFEDRITVTEAALTSQAGWADFSDNGAAHCQNGLVSTGHAAATSPNLVRTLTFDEVVASDPRPVDFVKIDCEGGEYDMVLGSSPTSWAAVSRVVLEHQAAPGQTWPTLREWFLAAGFSLVRTDEDGSDPDLGLAWFERRPTTPRR